MAERLLNIDFKLIEPNTIPRIKAWYEDNKKAIRNGAMAAVAIWSMSGVASEAESRGVFPDYSYHGKALSRVALQLLREGKTDSFQDAAEFRREHFERVRKSVLLIEALDVDENWLKNFTGWVAGRDENILYIAIENHSIESDQPIESFRIWRPQIDEMPQTFLFDPTRIARDTINDQAVIELKIDSSDSTDYIPLTFKDGYIPSSGTQVLVVGYPGAFAFPDRSNSLLPWNNLTYAKVLPVAYAHPNVPGWSSIETINKGISGAPTFILDEKGNLIVIGQAHINIDPVSPGTHVNVPTGIPPTILFSSLNVDTLMGELKRK